MSDLPRPERCAVHPGQTLVVACLACWNRSSLTREDLDLLLLHLPLGGLEGAEHAALLAVKRKLEGLLEEGGGA